MSKIDAAVKAKINTFADDCRALGAADASHAKALDKADKDRAAKLEERQKSITAEIKRALGDKAALKVTGDIFKANWIDGFTARKGDAAYRAANMMSGKAFDAMPEGDEKNEIRIARDGCKALARVAWRREKSLAETGTKTGAEKKAKKKGTKKTKAPPIDSDLRAIASVTKKDRPLLLALKWATKDGRDAFMAWAATAMPQPK